MARTTKAEREKAEAFARWLNEQPKPEVGTPYDKAKHPTELLLKHGLGVSYYDADYPVLVEMADAPKPIGGLEAIQDPIIEDDDGEHDAPSAPMLPSETDNGYIRQLHTNIVRQAQRVEPSPEAFERAEFVDRVAIELFANGWPKATIYSHGASLWELRKAWRREQGL